MRHTHFIFIFISVHFSFAQATQLPERISITDKYYTSGGSDFYYEYELELSDDIYSVHRTILQENLEKNTTKTEQGSVDKQVIEKMLVEMKRSSSAKINPADFIDRFPMDSIERFIETQGDYYWIYEDYQKQFVIEQLTHPNKLKHNLEQYFEGSEENDGAITEVVITFHFENSTTILKSNSFLSLGLPLEVNGKRSFSPSLANLIGKLVPESNTRRPKQFAGNKLFFRVMEKTIGSNLRTLEKLQSKTFKVYFDSLAKHFTVSGARYNNPMFSVNWEGERRLSCTLTNKLMPKNVSIIYSTPLENSTVKYPVSNIINKYKQLLDLMNQVAFLKEYLAPKSGRYATIIYDGHGCFTEKAKYNVKNYCLLSSIEIDFDNSLFLEVRENRFTSRWLILPNGQYFVWWSTGQKPKPVNDLKYLECE